jgi:hypothetical protein
MQAGKAGTIRGRNLLHTLEIEKMKEIDMGVEATNEK